MTIMLRRLLPGAAALALALTGFTQAAAAATHHPHHHSRRHHAAHHTAIPQHNGGDHDADNRGGPSDGDGAI